jgi:LAO/AO transport system kinase
VTDPAARAAELCDSALAGDRLALARLLTAVENRTAVAEAALRRLYPLAGRAHLVGITGPPGSGKSTLVAALIGKARHAGRAVGVIAVDPSSPITGGALLGDRVRMQVHAEDRDVFIRSMASRGHAGGLASASAAAAAVMDAAGFDLILLETVGTGQSEVEVAASADTTVVLEAPEMGDEIQAIKAGLLEVADIVVVNKGDRPGAQRTAGQLRAMLTASARAGQGAAARGHHGAALVAPEPGRTEPVPTEPGPTEPVPTEPGPTKPVATGSTPAAPPAASRPRPKEPQVLITTALTGDGVSELLTAIEARRPAGPDLGDVPERLARAEAQVWSVLGERVRSRLLAGALRPRTEATLAAVAEHRVDPYTAANDLLEALGARDS